MLNAFEIMTVSFYFMIAVLFICLSAILVGVTVFVLKEMKSEQFKNKISKK